MDGHREADACRCEPGQRLLRGQPERADGQLDEVGLDLVQVDRQPGLEQAFREPARPRVILGEPVDVVVEGVDAGGRDDPGLAHRPAEQVLEAPRLHHQLVGARDQGPERAAEPLGEAQRRGVRMLGDLRGGDAEGGRCVQHPGAVEVEADPERAALVGDGDDLGERPDPASRAVVRVLDRDDPRAGRVVVVPRPGQRPDHLGPEAAVRRRDRPRQQSGEHGRPTELRDHHVRVLFREQLVAGPAQDPERDLVRHRGRGHEHRLLVAQQLGGACLELVDGRVLALLLVADDGVRDRLAHAGSRLGERVGAELDHAKESRS